MATKECTKCGKPKPLHAFHVDRKRRDGRCARCKACKLKEKHKSYHTPGGRNSWIKRLYGMTEEQYEKLVAAQDNRCAACRQDIAECGRLVIDHNHTTGGVRALLCDRCNRVAGAASDNPGLLRKLAEYLETHAEDSTNGET